MPEFMVTIWQPIVIRFGPVEAENHLEASKADPADYEIDFDVINRWFAGWDLPANCWAEVADEAPINTLVFKHPDDGPDDNELFLDQNGNKVSFLEEN